MCDRGATLGDLIGIVKEFFSRLGEATLPLPNACLVACFDRVPCCLFGWVPRCLNVFLASVRTLVPLCSASQRYSYDFLAGPLPSPVSVWEPVVPGPGPGPRAGPGPGAGAGATCLRYHLFCSPHCAGIHKLRFKPAYNPYTEPSMEVFR